MIRLASVFVVRKVILRSVLLKKFVMYVISLPMSVKLAHFCVVWFVGLSGLGVGGFMWFLLGRSYCEGCYVLCSVLVDILFPVGYRSRVCCTGI